MRARRKVKFIAVQKIVKNGKSAQITLSRPLLYLLGVVPGEYMEIWLDEHGIGHFRPFVSMNEVEQLGIVAPSVQAETLAK